MQYRPVIEKGSLIVVTGVSGFLGSHVADQLLAAGYRVRAVSRSLDKLETLKSRFVEIYGDSAFEATAVADFTMADAFDAVLQGAHGVIHVASDTSLRQSRDDVVPTVLQGLKNVLKSAARIDTIQRFILTSSSVAVRFAQEDDKDQPLTKSLWNDYAITESKSGSGNAFMHYAAAKAEAEQLAWRFVEEEKPHFVLNTVLPTLNFGKILHGSTLSSGSIPVGFWEGKTDGHTWVPPYESYVDVQDTARIHLLALTHPDVSNQRIWTSDGPFEWNQVLNGLKKVRPDHKFPDAEFTPQLAMGDVDNSPGATLLKHLGRDGWTPLEESLRNNVAHL